MTEEIKYLAFKGIEKKEQIVLKSFLNLAKNELKYQIVVLKDNDASDQNPSVLIISDEYEFTEDEVSLESLPAVVVGDDMEEQWAGYITRPIQWSNFRLALAQFSDPTPRAAQVTEPVVGGQEQDEVVLMSADEDASEVKSVDVDSEQDDENRVLPEEIMFAIDDVDDDSIETNEEDEFAPIDHEFELDNMSIDYASHTNSDYMKVVDDVQQFNEGADGAGDAATAMLLVTDDESNSTNSVLVIETNSLDAWDFSVTESSASEIAQASIETESVAEMAKEAFDGDKSKVKAPKIKPKAGFDIVKGEKFWEEDNEIIADNVSVFCIKHQRNMVYSDKEPGLWLTAMQNKKLSKLPLSDDWRPKKGLIPYPLSQLVWVNSLMTETEKLADGLDDKTEYLLEKWPHFDLLQLDNVLLKLCSMLFVNPESLDSLVEKSGYSRSTARALMNACYQEGLLKKIDEVQIENLVAAENDGVFGKIKDVFR